MKKCPICDGENNDSAKRCGYCDYDFTSEIDSKKDNTGEMDHSKSDTVIEPSNKSVSIEHDKINACFEKNGHEEDNNDVLKCSMNIVDHNGHNNHIVPILITVIVLLCVGIIVLLLNGHKDNTSLNSEEISNDELFKPVVSEIYNTDVNNATLNNTDKSVETDNSVKYSDSNTVKETEALTNNSETRPDLDVDSSVTASYNSDGTIKIEYTAVPMTMTLPSSWAGKFVVRNGSVLARSAYYGDYGGMLIHLIFKDKNEGVEGISRYLAIFVATSIVS